VALFDLLEVEYSIINAQGHPRKLLTGVNLPIHEGETLTIIGPSGAGKSTLLNLLNRFKEITGGSIAYAGQQLQDYEVTSLRREVGMLLQKPHMLAGTVKDNLLVGPQLSRQRGRRSPEEIIKLVGPSPELLNPGARSLSGGEQQRISLARLLANEPRVLLLDEPTAALNHSAAEEIEELISHLVRQHQLTVVMITHDLDQARRLGTKTALLVNGQLAEYQPTDCFFNAPQSEETQHYLEENWHSRGVEL